MLASRYAEKVLWLKQYLSHLDYDTRECMARLLGIASSALPITASSELIGEVISSIGGTQNLRFFSCISPAGFFSRSISVIISVKG